MENNKAHEAIEFTVIFQLMNVLTIHSGNRNWWLYTTNTPGGHNAEPILTPFIITDFNTNLPSSSWSSKWLLLERLLHQNSLWISCFTISATCPTHCNLTDQTNLTVLCEVFKSQSSIFCCILHSLSVSGSNLVHIAHYSNKETTN